MKQKLLQGSVSDLYRHRCRFWTPETLTLKTHPNRNPNPNPSSWRNFRAYREAKRNRNEL